jgi:hypothetical protein
MKSWSSGFLLALVFSLFCARPSQDLTDVIADMPDPGWPVEVVRVESDDWGFSDWDEERETFVVSIREGIPHDYAVDTLVHEWAHLLVWDAVQESDHGPIWGVAYARCYRAAIEK